MDSRGQAALEYLLLLGGAILLAAIIIVIMAAMGISSSYDPAAHRYNTEFHTLYHSK
ncbi:MAG: class III signal peptide-containing protein [archaeon]|nr:class III signal peptide-containing protein [Candidatus Micrarchaeota archaeon]